MSSPPERTLAVEPAHENDVGRGVARLDPDTLLELELSPGDVAAVEGAATTVAKVWRSDRSDWNDGVVRVDEYTRESAGVDPGDAVTVRAADTDPAAELVLAAPAGADPEDPGAFGRRVQGQLLDRPVVEGDVVPVDAAGADAVRGLAEGTARFEVVETRPSGPVVVTDRTAVSVRTDPDGDDAPAPALNDAAVDAEGLRVLDHGVERRGRGRGAGRGDGGDGRDCDGDGDGVLVEVTVENAGRRRVEAVTVDVVCYADEAATEHLGTGTARTRQLRPGARWTAAVTVPGTAGASVRAYDVVVS